MMMPGFTAEAGLYQHIRAHGGSPNWATPNIPAIIPQFCRQNDGGIITCTDCVEFGGNSYCWTHIIRPFVLS